MELETKSKLIDRLAEITPDFCRRHHIRSIALFGSALGSDFGSESDIDLLIEFEPDHLPGLIRLAGMERELSEHLGGRTVDLRTAEDLSPYFRDEVVEVAELLHAQA